jgi:FkbM family methyltransferase
MKTIINDGLKFVCGNDAELWRARTLFTKEPGTIAWLQQLTEGDVFYDIGANVGCYTLYASRLVGPAGHVVAVEPHPANAAALLRNIAVNGLTNVTVLTSPLGQCVGVERLKLGDLQAGTSGSVVGNTEGVMTCVTSIDYLRLRALIPAASFVKIDVDGNELLILLGMVNTLKADGIRALQVESPPHTRARIEHFFKEHGYRKTGIHYTKDCQRLVDAGTSIADVIENSIFERAA